jgi:serine/threonine-protein kinase
LTGIVAILLLAAVAYVVYQLASGGGPGPSTPATVAVPNFVGDQIAAATTEAESLGITLVPTNQESSEVAGTILSQDPPEGTELASGGQVKVTVATPPGTVAVPDLKNQTERDAITILFANRLAPGVKSESYDPVVPEGLVVSQTPTAGTPVAPQSAVDYVLSLGPEPTPSPTPSPTPTPTPEPTPTPTPEPTPAPTPEPTPTPEVTLPPEPPVESPLPP